MQTKAAQRRIDIWKEVKLLDKVTYGYLNNWGSIERAQQSPPHCPVNDFNWQHQHIRGNPREVSAAKCEQDCVISLPQWTAVS